MKTEVDTYAWCEPCASLQKVVRHTYERYKGIELIKRDILIDWDNWKGAAVVCEANHHVIVTFYEPIS